jgi:hypothetical protein
MKKYIITSVIAISAVSVSYAQSPELKRVASSTKPTPRPAMQAVMNGNPAMITGDKEIDAKVKALREEMDKKIQAIRSEYEAKIKAVIGDKKLLKPEDAKWEKGSSTMRMDIKKASSTMMRASGTPEGRPMIMNREDGRMPNGRMVKGESTEAGEEQVQPQGGFKSFFSKFFGN